MSQLPRIVPLAPARSPHPFDHPEWLFALKMDGWRSLAFVDNGRVDLVSRWGNRSKRVQPLEAALAQALGRKRAVLDGEIVQLDEEGRSVFFDLMRRR